MLTMNDKVPDAGYNTYHSKTKETPRISLSQFSILSDISRDTLVYYIKEGLITPAITENNGYHYFYPDQLRTMTFIKYMRRFGIHISEIKAMLDGMDTDGIYHILNSHSREIDEQMQKTAQALQFLDNFQILIDFIDEHPVDTPFLCNLEETDLYLMPVPFVRPLSQPADAEILSDFLEFDNSGLPEYLICCRIPEKVLVREDFCTFMHENAETVPDKRMISRPAGTYACIIHQGDNLTIKETVRRLKGYLASQAMEPAGDAYILNSAGFFNLSLSGMYKYLVEIPVKPVQNNSDES